MRYLRGFWPSGCLLVCAAQASAQSFTSCDGYPAPEKKSDGITKGSWLWGLASTASDIRQEGTIRLGEAGVSACDSALADPLLRPEFALRRVHLLQIKALHQIAAGKPSDALNTLDAALAIPLDPANLRDKGLGLANKALRATALIDLGRREEANALIHAISEARPYASSIQLLVSTLGKRSDPSLEFEFADTHRRMALNPQAAPLAIIQEMLTGRKDDVIALSDGLKFDLPKMRGGWSIEGNGLDDYELISVRAQFAGVRAYSLAAVGRDADSKKAIEAAHADLDEAKAPPVAKPGQQISKKASEDYDRRKVEADKGEIALSGWEARIALRRKTATLSADDFFAELKKIDGGASAAMIDLMESLKSLSPADGAIRDRAFKQLQEGIEVDRRRRVKTDLTTILSELPRPETDRNQPNFHGAGDGYFLSDNGYSTKQMDSPAKWTVRFANNLATDATVEELVLASAASLAKKKGYAGFVVLSRRTFERTTHVTQYGLYGGGSYDQNSGREAQLVVYLVNPGQFPDELSGAEQRYFDADKVLAEIMKSYQSLAARSK